MNNIDTLIRDAWNDSEAFADYDKETGFVEYYASERNYVDSCYRLVETVIDEYEQLLFDKIDACGVDIDINRLMEETKKELGI